MGEKMRMQEKKQLVLEYLYKAMEEDKAIGSDLKGFRSPTQIGVEALGVVRYNASSKASPVCKSLVAEVMIERHHMGWYCLSGKGIHRMHRKMERERQRNDMPDYIRLTCDLPVSAKHKCFEWSVFKVNKIYREDPKGAVPQGRLVKVEFISESGEPVCALPGEFEWIGV